MGPVVRREPIDVTGQKQEATPEMEAIASSATKRSNPIEWNAEPAKLSSQRQLTKIKQETVALLLRCIGRGTLQFQHPQ